MRFLSDLKAPFPKSFQTAAEFALNSGLRRALEAEEINLNQIRSFLEEAQLLGVPLDGVSLGYAFQGRIERTALQFQANPKDISLLQKFDAAWAWPVRYPSRWISGGFRIFTMRFCRTPIPSSGGKPKMERKTLKPGSANLPPSGRNCIAESFRGG